MCRMRAVSNLLWKRVAVIVVAATAISVSSLATEQTLAHALQNRSADIPSRAITGQHSASESTVSTRPVVLLLLQGGTIGPITSSVVAGGGGSSSGGSLSIS